MYMLKVFLVILNLIKLSLMRRIVNSLGNSTVSEEYMRKINEHPNWYLLDADACGNSLADRIIGGQNASLGQYPWLARLGYTTLKNNKPRTVYSCGGALITPCYVLTASHCVTDLPNHTHLSTVRLGEYNTLTKIDCDADTCADPPQDFSPAKILIHSDYGVPRYRNDIALIQLNQPATFTVWVSPICLPRGSLIEKNITGEIAEVAGWGVTNMTTKKGSAILQTLKVPITTISSCQNTFRRYIDIVDTQLCAGGEMGRDSCGGDSGGPLMKVDTLTTPKFYVFGIVSFGSKNCGKRATPGVYTKVVDFLEWILDNISDC